MSLSTPQSIFLAASPGIPMTATRQATEMRELQQKLLRAVTSAGNKADALAAASIVVSEVALVSAAPVIFRGRLPEAIALILPRNMLPVESLSCVTQLLAVHFTLWHILQGALVSETESQTLAAVLELLGKLETAADLPGACHWVVGAVQSHLACQRVALGLVEGVEGRCRLRAVSDASRFDAHSVFVRDIEAALEESVARASEAHWPTPTTAATGSVLALRALCTSSQCAAGVSSPLKNQRVR